MLQCPKLKGKVLIWTYTLIDSRDTKLCLHLMQNHGKQALTNHISYQTTCSRLAHTSHGNRALGTEQNNALFPSLQKVCTCQRKENEKDFICGDTFHLSLHIFCKFTS